MKTAEEKVWLGIWRKIKDQSDPYFSSISKLNTSARDGSCTERSSWQRKKGRRETVCSRIAGMYVFVLILKSGNAIWAVTTELANHWKDTIQERIQQAQEEQEVLQSHGGKQVCYFFYRLDNYIKIFRWTSKWLVSRKRCGRECRFYSKRRWKQWKKESKNEFPFSTFICVWHERCETRINTRDSFIMDNLFSSSQPIGDRIARLS